MKRKRSDVTRESGTVAKSGKMSSSAARLMISKEVQDALERSDLMLKALMERIQEVDNEPKYESRIKKLEMHVKKVKRRGDKVFTYIRRNPALLQNQSSLSLDPLAPADPHRRSPAPETRDHEEPSSAKKGRSRDSPSPSAVELDGTDGGSVRKPKEGFWQRLRSKKQIVDLTDDEGSRQNGTRHGDSAPSASPVTVDVDSRAEEEADQALEGVEGSEPAEPVTSETKIKEKEVILTLPLLPMFPFPDQLPAAALTKSLPQKPVVKLARIDSPRGIALLWNVEKADLDPAPVAYYYVYTAQQRGNGTFSRWKIIGEIKAMPLPMACRVAARSGSKALFFAIVGKDVYGRYGAFSEVCTTWDGEM